MRTTHVSFVAIVVIIIISACGGASNSGSSNAGLSAAHNLPTKQQMALDLPDFLFEGQSPVPSIISRTSNKTSGNVSKNVAAKAVNNVDSSNNNNTDCSLSAFDPNFWAECADKFARDRLFNVSRSYNFIESIVIDITAQIAQGIPANQETATLNYTNSNIRDFSGTIKVDVYYENSDENNGINNCEDRVTDPASYYQVIVTTLSGGALSNIDWCLFTDGSVTGRYVVYKAFMGSGGGQAPGVTTVNFTSNDTASIKEIFISAKNGVITEPAAVLSLSPFAKSVTPVEMPDISVAKALDPFNPVATEDNPSTSIIDQGGWALRGAYKDNSWQVQLGQHVQLWVPCPEALLSEPSCNELEHEGLVRAPQTSVLLLNVVAKAASTNTIVTADGVIVGDPSPSAAVMNIIVTDSDLEGLYGDAVSDHSIWKYMTTQYQAKGLEWPANQNTSSNNPVFIAGDGTRSFATAPSDFPSDLTTELNNLPLITTKPCEIGDYDDQSCPENIY